MLFSQIENVSFVIVPLYFNWPANICKGLDDGYTRANPDFSIGRWTHCITQVSHPYQIARLFVVQGYSYSFHSNVSSLVISRV
jgi:hypothetical protein